MKILYRDDLLKFIHPDEFPIPKFELLGGFMIVDGRDGYTKCMKKLKTFRETNPDGVVLTNFIFALNGEFSWNEDLKKHEILIYKEEYDKYIPVQELTNRELRLAHNMVKMYVAGEFGCLREAEVWEEV